MGTHVYKLTSCQCCQCRYACSHTCQVPAPSPSVWICLLAHLLCFSHTTWWLGHDFSHACYIPGAFTWFGAHTYTPVHIPALSRNTTCLLMNITFHVLAMFQFQYMVFLFTWLVCPSACVCLFAYLQCPRTTSWLCGHICIDSCLSQSDQIGL